MNLWGKMTVDKIVWKGEVWTVCKFKGRHEGEGLFDILMHNM